MLYTVLIMDTNTNPAPAAEAMNAGTAAPATKKVFIVEDDVFLGRVLSGQIREAKMDAQLFTMAEDALEALKTTIPSIILMDIFLPGINGLDALEQIRKNEATKHVPVLVVSNTDEAKDRDRAVSLGAEFMIKGASTPDDIVKHVADILEDSTQ